MLKLIFLGINQRASALGLIVKSTLTGPDGQSWAPGRILGFALFGITQGIVVRATGTVIARAPTAADWAIFLPAVAAFEGVVCTIAIGLVLGMAPSDFGGRWWGKEASPPPPPMPPQR